MISFIYVVNTIEEGTIKKFGFDFQLESAGQRKA